VQRFWLCLRVSSVGVTAPMQKTTATVFSCNFLCIDTAILFGTVVQDRNSVLDCGEPAFFFAIAVLDCVATPRFCLGLLFETAIQFLTAD